MPQILLAPAPTQAQTLPPVGSWPQASHVWSQPELDALAAAAFSGRPLLIKGEPGVGKSQIARAAAALLQWDFLYDVITPRFDPQDLKWRDNTLARLADATRGDRDVPDSKYITAGALWRALDPASAPRADPADVAQAKPGCVLLLDEIDKADSDLPNSLLEVLGNRGFKNPWGLPVPANPDAPPKPLLIVITSNDEREMPTAFMRRCVVFEIKAPDERNDPVGFKRWLRERGQAQFPDIGRAVLDGAATQVQADRADTVPGQGARPGLAEYLDLLRALHQIAPGDAKLQKAWLKRISPFVLLKQGQDQSTSPTRRNTARGSDLDGDAADAE
jgi:MoxR-like ATPase